MKLRQWGTCVAAISAVVAISVGGCGDDVTNNNYGGLSSGDSGVDVLAALSTLGCPAGKKECINDAVARVCPADGTAWVGVACRAGETCKDGDCKPVAGGQTAACVPGDGACLPNNKALRCREDGAGYEQFDCPANTACQNRGVCQGAFAVGSSTCSGDRRSFMTYEDGFHPKQTMCAANEYCVTLHTTPYSIVACKPAQCKPAAAGSVCGEQSVCGDPINPANDQTKFVASCTETPDGFKWVGSPCAAGTTCNPVGSSCSTTGSNSGRTQAACGTTTCTEGTQRCSPDGNGLQTCGADGRWGATVTPCNLAGGERCLTLPATSATGLARVVCGDPLCGIAGEGTCEDATNKIRKCDANGKLTAAAECAIGRCQRTVQLTGTSLWAGRCIPECTPGTEDCNASGNGSNSFRVCQANSRWGAPTVCPSEDGSVTTCTTVADQSVPGIAKHYCVKSGDCAPGQTRCVSSDGGSLNDQIQQCDANGQWKPAQACTAGYCSVVGSPSAATCIQDCVPGSQVCDPGGSGKFYVCPPNGSLAGATYDQSCAVSGTQCKRAGTRSLGCIECAGQNLVDGVFVPYVESRCLLEDGGPLGSSMLQTCSPNNTWGTAVTCSGGTNRCSSGFSNVSPGADPGGVRSAYCF